MQKACYAKEWNWDDEEDVRKGYYGEVEELLKRVTGCARVVSESGIKAEQIRREEGEKGRKS